MKREIMKVAVCGALAVCMTVTTGFASVATGTQSETQGLIALLESNTALNTTLDDITETLPEAVEAAMETQEWYKKALANTETEASIYEGTDENSKVVGKMYKNTIVDIEEKGDEWTKISSGEVNGYVKNSSLAFGLNAVERAKEVCPAKAKSADGTWITVPAEENAQAYAKENNVTIIRETQDAKTIERIQAEEEARRKAAEEAARKKAAEEAARKKAAEEAARKKAAEKAAARRKAGTSPKMSASVDDRTLLASIIYCEAGGEPYEGKVAVGAVILNRVRSGRFPNSIRGVIYQRGQFGPASSGKLARVLASGKATSACYKAADAALAGSNPIGNRMFFGNGNTGLKIGNHYFH